MSSANSHAWAKTKKDIRTRMISGLLLLIPFFVTVVVIRWLFHLFAGLLKPLIVFVLEQILDPAGRQAIPEFYVSAAATLLSVVILVLLIYAMGAIAQFVIGRRMIHVGEGLMLKIPLVGTVYSATKQVVQAMSLSDKAAFKAVVLVEFPRPGFKAVAFSTGRIQDSQGKAYSKVFIPTTPNPTTGFFELVPVEEVVETSLTIEEAFKMIISGGLISPDVLVLEKPKPPVHN
jgi:uncharacterized membrane protein